MAKTQTLDNGIIEFYTDFTDFQYFECPKCHNGNKNWTKILHKKNCKWVADEEIKRELSINSKKLREEILKKLTDEEKQILGIGLI